MVYKFSLLALFGILLCVPMQGQNSQSKPRSGTLHFEFTKKAMVTLKEIIRVECTPPQKEGIEDSLLDDLDTEARTPGETQTVALLKDVKTQISVNNMVRTKKYYELLIAKLDHNSQTGDVGHTREVEIVALQETMQIPDIASVSKKDQTCTSSLDKMIRAAVYSKQPACVDLTAYFGLSNN